MNLLKFILMFCLCFATGQLAQAKVHKKTANKKIASHSIPYCSKKITRGCVKRHRGQTAKFYVTPKYSGKKVARYSHLSAKKVKRGTASVLQLKIKKNKSKKKKH